VLEVASASGLPLVSPERRDPLRTTSFGSGELIAAALDAGARQLIVGLGGVATNDLGAEALNGLGVGGLVPLVPGPMGVAEAVERAPELLAAAAERLLRLVLALQVACSSGSR